jgi:UDP:flavonoid glycosyltransferase YjiC (YdhE family)
MAHIHFAWELGGGLGHAGRLKPLAQEAVRRGHRVTMSLRDLVHTNALLHDVNVPRFQAPIWLHQVHGVPNPQVSLAEILLTCGYLNADALQGLVVGWHQLLGTLKPDLLVADYAPTAVLAARCLGLRSATVGIGFFIPPDESPLPSLRDWEPAQPGRLQNADAQMLASVNTALARHGGPPLARAAQVLQGDAPLRLTWPELDHYGRTQLPAGQRWWGPSMSPGAGVPPTWPAGSGPKVFAYIKSTHPDHVALLNALVRRGCRTVCYLPEVALGAQPPVVSPLLSYSEGPVDLALALPDCELCICHAGEATLAQALLYGVPVLLLPTQAEQFLMSRQVALTGAGINAAAMRRPVDYSATIGAMLGTSSYRAAARAFADRYADFTPRQHTQDLVDEFERLVS